MPIPGIKGADAARLNIVPADFVIGAIELLSALPHSVDRTYQLADPDPLTVDETIDLLAEATGRTVARVPISKGMARALIGGVPGVARWTGIQPESLDYFDHPAHYSVQNTLTGLHGSGISIPPLASYVGKLVEFVRAHPEIGSGRSG